MFPELGKRTAHEVCAANVMSDGFSSI